MFFVYEQTLALKGNVGDLFKIKNIQSFLWRFFAVSFPGFYVVEVYSR